MHLDEEGLQRLLDGELSAAAAHRAHAHLAGCEDCRSRLTAAEREQAELFATLRALDRPAGAVSVAAVLAAGPRGASSVPPVPRVRLAWAAGFAIALALGGIAYALPGSPLRAWIAALANGNGFGGAARTEAPAPAPVAPEMAGVSVPPGERLVISFLHARAGARVRIGWSDGAEVEVRAPRGAASFESAAGTLRIDDREPVLYEVRIPRSAPEIELEAEGARLFRKAGERVTGPAPDAAGEYLLALGPSTH
jgi:anti-sigma factor RsiW